MYEIKIMSVTIVQLKTQDKNRKHAKYDQRVLESWFERPEFSNFVKHSEFKVKCLECSRLINVRSCGITSLKAHLNSKRKCTERRYIPDLDDSENSSQNNTTIPLIVNQINSNLERIHIYIYLILKILIHF